MTANSFEFENASRSPVFSDKELQLIDTAGKQFSNEEERWKIASKLFDEINALTPEDRSRVLQHMEDKLNPDDPLDRVNKELRIVPRGVSCVHNADKYVVAATVNGYEMTFHAPSKAVNAPFNVEAESARVIEIAKQNTGNPRLHDSGPRNNNEQRALSQSLSDELALLSPPQKTALISHMFDKYSSKDQLDKNRREQMGIPLGVELDRSTKGVLLGATINGLTVRF